ncbi:MAG TPA: hypothetical protein VHT51_18775 [Micropepsaceae bacterium]|nr:hypothetical protein [Micropepsaceae bacterium]
MVTEQEVLDVLAKPLSLYTLQHRLNPGKGADALQELLMQMRDAGKVRFNINTGRWSKS